ncbi:MAG: DNA polymerase III subunit delta [Treponemataceae bacterium]|nr:DNA polymerase III subunit delta [Treponemataceae bacterium]
MYSIPLFLYTGPEFGERNDAVAELRRQAEKKFGSIDYHQLYTMDVSFGDVLSLLRNGNLFVPARFVVLRGVESIKKKDDIDLLAKWCDEMKKTQADDVWFVLVSDETSVEKKVEGLVPKEHRKIFWELFEDRKEKWLESFFYKNGYKLTPDAVALILSLVENNTEALRNECSRFFVCFEKDHIIDSDDVEAVLAHNREESAFTLFDAMADASHGEGVRLSDSLSVLQKLRNSKDSASVQIIAGLTWCFRRLKVWHTLAREGGMSDFNLKTNGFQSKKMQQKYRMAAQIWSLKDTESAIALLSDMDMFIRSSGSGVDSVSMQTLVYCLCIKKGAPLCKFEIS